MKLSEIASIISAEFNSDDIEIIGMNTLLEASNGEVSFISNTKYIKYIQKTKATAVIISKDLADNLPDECVALVVDNPYWAMAILSKSFAPPIEDDTLDKAIIDESSKVSSKAHIANGAVVGKNCTILAHAYVGTNSIIGNNTIIYSNVTIYRDCKIGSDCIIHSNTAIGSDGFGFATNEQGEHKKIYQNGNVIIENDVEIGSNSSIDRAVFGTTHIKKGVRIDNLVQIGHNCEVGEYSVFVAQSGASGSTVFGRNVVMGGQSATVGHIKIAPFTTMAARSGVTKSITEGGKTYSGFPLMEHRVWMKLQAKIARLLKV